MQSCQWNEEGFLPNGIGHSQQRNIEVLALSGQTLFCHETEDARDIHLSAGEKLRHVYLEAAQFVAFLIFHDESSADTLLAGASRDEGLVDAHTLQPLLKKCL